ncbi:phage tail protein [Actinokineospora pegani]|uniref:phage tail protein n=1 Tax=Actinokineospora pegani TaxID=2654637 RepID=UPI0012EA6B0F|nr:phage tail protein [Actinokineospora pegani]
MANPPTLAHGMAHRFVVSAGSRDLGAWSKVAGLSVKWDLAEYRVGHSDQYFKFAGVPKFATLKLSRAADTTGTKAVQTWLGEVQASGGTPEEGAVEMLTSAGDSVIVWTLREMFPIAWQISEFDATTGKVAMETLEIVYSGFLLAAQQAGA